ncbi:MAG: Holliday junction resolvase RuvX [Synechococcus sp. SB0668_bin_15]|nr:Holliday junction resolvase RuvX [Synechococcus sp. SB0668_bin_15]MXZ83833.1 Holliday junction resolvase RuvX [Synechococcus sp. SB0666_bin_14]MYA91486.1 Holliday junction resolvase RuvX [Synechococcus sp. SB0663_bin_10]MYC50080.1 Holliday junction resolvase RuvX [Synechococcus sp. SB0662_bin_14]MYG46799.1 Holliday junction resolvase RuvX [Synechococcus sp. SB0675_bin_6]MYJ59042.1 Holliday junction resolvase RuvX [Synechococcus sp. SB0672_bin_6]MYK90783.1 Holliday junction resolvase RuvX [
MPARPSPPCPRSVLALDVGRRRVGLAGCDPLGISVRPLPPLQRRDLATDVARLRPLCQTRAVAALVVGLPLLPNGEEGSQCRQCRRYGLALARALALPLAWVDERYTSWAAGETTGLRADGSGRLDSAAAALILSQWLAEGPEPMDLEQVT